MGDRQVDQNLLVIETYLPPHRQVDQNILIIEATPPPEEPPQPKQQIDSLVLVQEVRPAPKRQTDSLHLVMEVGIPVWGASFSEVLAEYEIPKRAISFSEMLSEYADPKRSVSFEEILAEYAWPKQAVSLYDVLVEYTVPPAEGKTQIRGWDQIQPHSIMYDRFNPAIVGEGLRGPPDAAFAVQLRRTSQSALPTPSAGRLWAWHDTDTGKVYLVYNDPDSGVVAIELIP